MSKIRVTAGTIGFYDKGHNHVTKSASDAPFECEDKQAAYFVEQGVAAYVAATDKTAPAAQTDTQQEGQADGSQEHEKLTGHLDAAQLETMTNDQLKNLAGDLGVDITGCKKKADYIAVITAAEIEIGDEGDGDELPDLGAADPE